MSPTAALRSRKAPVDAETFRRFLAEGVEHFNALRFYEAHESWETLWLASVTTSREFLKGLIQLAAAYHHLRRGTFGGAVRLFDTASSRLRPFPPHYCGIEREGAQSSLRGHREWAAAFVVPHGGRVAESLPEADYPTLMLVEGWESLAPPHPEL